jgi:flagellar M-ring protein FliF
MYMALINTEDLAAQTRGFNALPVVRQVSLMFGLAASVALGVYVVLWSQTPDYSILYGRVSDADAAQIAESLDQAGIPYRMESGSGAITVPGDRVHEARLKLASKGLPRGDGNGFELFEKSSSFGTSRFMEKARYNRAIEGELSRTIAKLHSVESARVHLAIPKQSVFVRDKSKTRASVVLNLFSNSRLDEERITGIVHLVAASVPGLEADQVTVVDQKGRLLTNDNSSGIAASSSQLAYTRSLESLYVQRIKDILVPVLGEDAVRAQVVADVDFTMVETTTESYQPDNRAIRSEDVHQEKTTGNGAAGVPGALSNQPPTTGTTNSIEITEATEAPVNSVSRATRNYEIDRSISHSRTSPGQVKHLSVAVVVDYREQAGEDGVVERVPLSEDEMARIRALVKDAVGYDAERNDSVNVTNITFTAMEEIEPLPEAPVWEQAWLWDAGKKVLGGLMVLLMVFGVLRPVMRSLAVNSAAVAALPPGTAEGQPALAADQLSLANQPAAPQLSQEQQFAMARELVSKNPQQGAKVIKEWVAADG